MRAEIDLAKQGAKSEADLQKIQAQSRAKQDDMYAQKLAELQHNLISSQLLPQQNQGKPRPDNANK